MGRSGLKFKYEVQFIPSDDSPETGIFLLFETLAEAQAAILAINNACYLLYDINLLEDTNWETSIGKWDGEKYVKKS